MAYIPSHQELKDHPKTRRAARRCGVSIPTMVGHLHLLWWWALDHGPGGDLSRFESEDLADAAMWEGDPEEFVKALVDCGPGASEGFLTSSGQLHDWSEYGGKYGQRVQAARKAAAVRWQSNGNAAASEEQPPDASECDRNADAMRTHSGGNAEERRGEESPPGGGNGKPPFYQRLATKLTTEHGCEFPPRDTNYEAFHDLLEAALERLPSEQQHGTVMGVIADFVRITQDMPLTSQARNHTARLVRNHKPLNVFYGYGQALDWGAGCTEEYAQDPLALSKYVAGVLAKLKGPA